jgi:NitT/TauT family transport system substrate-binding protein
VIRRDAVRLLALSSAAVLAAARGAAAQGAAEKLRVAGPPTEDSANLYYAIKTGLFARAGLDVEMVNTSNGSAATEAVVTGTYEIAKTNLLSLCSAHLHGIPLVLVAPELMYSPRNPSILLQMAPDATFRTGADVNGKTAGVPALNTGASLMTNAWVDRNGGNWRSLKFVEITNAAMEAAIVAHRVDFGVLQPPQLDASLASGSTKTLGDCMGAIAPNYMYGGYIARRDWTSRHADAVRKFGRVLADATTYVNAHLAETAPLVAEFTKIEVANVAKMHRSVNGTTLDPALVQPFIDAAAKYEEIPRAFPARELIWSG